MRGEGSMWAEAPAFFSVAQEAPRSFATSLEKAVSNALRASEPWPMALEALSRRSDDDSALIGASGLHFAAAVDTILSTAAPASTVPFASSSAITTL